MFIGSFKLIDMRSLLDTILSPRASKLYLWHSLSQTYSLELAGFMPH